MIIIYKKEGINEYKTSYEGLSCVEIEEKQDEYGKNILDFKNNNTVFNRLKEAFINPFNIVLILIVSTVFISAMISFFQQTNPDKSSTKTKEYDFK